MHQSKQTLKLKYLGIDTYKESVIYLRKDCHICKSEGFEVHTRIKVSLNNISILATLNLVEGNLLGPGEAGLSNQAWISLKAKEGEKVKLSHPKPLDSLSFVRSKVYGHSLNDNEISSIINDITKGRYLDIHIATFLTACANGKLSDKEIISITKAIVEGGKTLKWKESLVVDKHCVGGLPGNRTTLIVVPIVAAFGLLIPKTSSRAITSPAGTADTMEVLAPVNLDLKTINKVIEKERGCIAWGGAVPLSPADDILIHVEKAMDLDIEGQLVASIISKKIAAGSNHVVIDMPIGATTKVRSIASAQMLEQYLNNVSKEFGINLEIMFSDGKEPVGCGIGPSLEARDVLYVLQGNPNAPESLRKKSIAIAGKILEFSPAVPKGTGIIKAEEILTSGKAWKKFQAICDAQGGMREIKIAKHLHVVESNISGEVSEIDNRHIARLAKLAGAPNDKAAGVDLHISLYDYVRKGQPLFTIHSESKGELNYALSMLEDISSIIKIKD